MPLRNPLDIYEGTDAGLSAGGVSARPRPRPRPAAAPIVAGGGGGGGAAAAPAVVDPADQPSGSALARGLAQPGSTGNRPRPGAFGRALGDVSAVAGDVDMAPGKAVADVINRGAIGLYNIGADALGAPNVRPRPMNYGANQDRLAEIRASNAQAPATAGAAAAPTAPAAAMPQLANAPVRRPQPRTAGAVNTPPYTATIDAAAPPPASPNLRTLDGRPGSVASSVGENGENVYDNNSIARIEARTGGRPQPTAVAAAAPAVAPAVAPTQGYTGPTFNLSQDPAAERERQAQLSRIDSDLSGLGTLNSRGKRAQAEQLRAQRQELVTLGYNTSTGRSARAADLDVESGRAALDANSRAAEQQSSLTAQQREAEARRAFDAQEGQVTESGDGLAVVRRDGSSRPVVGRDGQPIPGRPRVDPAVAARTKEKDSFNADALDILAARLKDVDGGQATPEMISDARVQTALARGLEIRQAGNDRYINIGGEIIKL